MGESQKHEGETLNARQTESFVRLEAVEDNICQMSAEQQQLRSIRLDTCFRWRTTDVLQKANPSADGGCC